MMASPPSSQNWKEKPCSWSNTNLDVLYFSKIYLPLNSIFNNQLSLYLGAKNGIVIRSFFSNFLLSNVWGISLIFFGRRDAKICPQSICCLWCASNTKKTQMTFIHFLQLFFLWTSWHHTYEKMVKFQAYLM
jgi:hypothetical protein